MSVVVGDLIYYAAASMPQDDASTAGGAIDTAAVVVPTSASLFNSLADKVDVVSANAGDTTQTVTVTGRLASGVIDTEVLALNGTTAVLCAKTFQSILKIVVSASHAGVVTCTKHTGGATITTIAVGILTVRRMFYNAIANPTGGTTKVFYEKLFVKNTNGVNALLAAAISETSDPSTVLAFALAAAVNDSVSVANRLTAPAGGLTFDSAAKNVPGTDLAAGAAIGVWAQLTLTAGAAASEYAWGLQAAGNTT